MFSNYSPPLLDTTIIYSRQKIDKIVTHFGESAF